jgi:hypothetical protein
MLQKRSYEVRGTSRRGVRRSQKPFRALRSGGWEGGEATPVSARSFEPPRLLGTSRQASRSGQRGAGTHCCKASEPLGAKPVRRDRGARFSRIKRSNPRGTIERMTVERTSVSGGRSTLRGELRNRRPQRLAHRVRAVASTRCAREMRKGHNRPLHAPRTHDRGVRGGFRGGASRRRKTREPSLRPAGPRSPCIFGCMWISWLVARVGSQGSAKSERR